jgi:hypothetical protein
VVNVTKIVACYVLQCNGWSPKKRTKGKAGSKMERHISQ